MPHTISPRSRSCYSFRISCLTALLGLIITLTPPQHARAQVASPANFPHATGDSYDYLFWLSDYPDEQAITMGMNGWSAITHLRWPSAIENRVMDSTMAIRFTFKPTAFTPSNNYLAIHKDGRIWYSYSNAGDGHVTVLSRNGAILTQFRIAGHHIRGLEADTSGHIFLTYTNNSTAGFGLMRFSNSYVPDFQKWVTVPGFPTEAQWALDQRLYVRCGTGYAVLDANGNLHKHITNLNSPISVFLDHGLTYATATADTVQVMRLDSNMNILWAKRLQGGDPRLSNNSNFTVDRIHAAALPLSGDVLLLSSIHIQYPAVCSTVTTIYQPNVLVLDKNGSLVGEDKLHLDGSHWYDARHLLMRSSPYGDPIVLSQWDLCFIGGNQWYPEVSLLAGYDYRQTCGGAVPNETVFNYTPPSLPAIGTGSVATQAIPLVPESIAIDVQPWGPGFYNYHCNPPCLTVTSQALGGGQVAFSDDAFGFHSISYDFGDGTFGSTPDPVHQYANPGNYIVRVILTNSCGADTLTLNAPACVSPVIAGPTTGCGTGAVTFQEGSSLPGTNLTWLVNGTQAGTGTTLNWTPPSLGNFQIGLIYVDSSCVDTAFITYSANSGLPVPAFTLNMLPTRTILCNNTSTNAVSYAWTFGDGGTSTATSPTYTYAANGPYTVCLTATNACGSAQTCHTMPCAFPIAGFNLTYASNSTIAFANTSTGATTYAWDFGDGNTSTLSSPTHTYTAGGSYQVCLTATNACMSNSYCATVSALTNSQTYFRMKYAVGTSSYLAQAVATNQGKTMMICNGSTNHFILVVDTMGQVLAEKNFLNSQILKDLTPMPNGNFLVAGEVTGTGPSGTNGLWMEVSPTGAATTATVIGSNANESITSIQPSRDGGYLFSGVFGTSSIYGKLNANLQLQWARSTALQVIRLFQAPDLTYWLVGYGNSTIPTLRFLHLNSLGVETGEYATTITASTAYSPVGHLYEAAMTCDGTIYVSTALNDFVNTAYFKKIILTKFDTGNHTGITRGYRISSNSVGNAPLYSSQVNQILTRSDGTLLLLGDVAQDPNAFPQTEKFILNVDANTLAINSASAYGSVFTSNDSYTSACELNNGTIMAFGIGNSDFQLHKFDDPIVCQMTTSPLTPYATLEYANAVFTSNPPAFNSAAWGSTSTMAPTSSTTAPTVLLQSASACTSAPVASMTYTVSGNQATITSTSTPFSNLTWTVAGQTCLSGQSITIPVTCTGTTVTLTAANTCGSSTVSQVVFLPTYSTSLGPDLMVCPGASAALTPGPGYTAYHWNNAATTPSISVSAPGIYSVTVTNGSGCLAADSILISNFAPPTFTLGQDTAICPDTTIVLTAPVGAASYIWSTGATTQTIAAAAAANYWVMLTDANGCTASDTLTLSVYADCVWPGDANHDGIADNQDILAIGYGLAYTGPIRPGASPAWYGQTTPNWLYSLPGNINGKHPDCDGNGTIDFPDTSLVLLNYSLTHNKATLDSTGYPLAVIPERDTFPAGDTVFFAIRFGDISQPLSNAHGLAFTLSIAPQHVTPGTLYARYLTSFLGNYPGQLLAFSGILPGNPDFHTAITRMDRVGQSGQGDLMRVGFFPDAVIPISPTLGYIPIHLSNAAAVDGAFGPLQCHTIDDTLLIHLIPNAILGSSPVLHCELYPVPASEAAQLSFQTIAPADVNVIVTDLHGRTIWQSEGPSTRVAGHHTVTIPTQHLSNSIYLVKLQVAGQTIVKKLVVER